MPSLTIAQQEFEEALKAVDTISYETRKKLVKGLPCRADTYRKLKDAGIAVPDNKVLFAGLKGLPFKGSQAETRMATAKVERLTREEAPQFTEEEKEEIRQNYRRTSQGLAPLLADGSRPPATDRPSAGDVEYWAQRAIAIGVAKPRAPIPPPTGDLRLAPGTTPASIEVPQPPRGRMEVIDEEPEQVVPLVDIQKLAGKSRPPPPENLAPIIAAARQRFAGKPVEPSSDETGKFLTLAGKVIGMGESWEEAFDAAEMELASPTVSAHAILEEKEETSAVQRQPLDHATAETPRTATPERAIDKLGNVARQASEVLGHRVEKWFRPDGEEDHRLVASCKVCNAGVEVVVPAVDGGSNIRGRAYTTICQGN